MKTNKTCVPPVEVESEPGLFLGLLISVNCLWREGEWGSKSSTVPFSLCCPFAGAPAEPWG